jgi:hypothetical protein
MAISLGAIAFSFERFRRVKSALRFDPALLRKELGREATAEGLRRTLELVEAAGPSWEAEFFGDLSRARDERECVAVTNEHLGDLASRLGWGARIPIGAARVSLAGSLAIAFFWIAGGRGGWVSLSPLVLSAGLGFFGSSWAGRRADRVADRLRRETDTLVAHALTAARKRSVPGGHKN